jgi:hypothetical protein
MTDRNVHYMVARAGRVAGLSFTTHPHQLRHIGSEGSEQQPPVAGCDDGSKC